MTLQFYYISTKGSVIKFYYEKVVSPLEKLIDFMKTERYPLALKRTFCLLRENNHTLRFI